MELKKWLEVSMKWKKLIYKLNLSIKNTIERKKIKNSKKSEITEKIFMKIKNIFCYIFYYNLKI